MRSKIYVKKIMVLTSLVQARSFLVEYGISHKLKKKEYEKTSNLVDWISNSLKDCRDMFHLKISDESLLRESDGKM